MKYPNIIRGEFISRPNRFIAQVNIKGRNETVHVKNTGRCKELLIPGSEVWLTAPGTPGRKTLYDLVAVKKSNGRLINIDSQAPNKAVLEWLKPCDNIKITPEYTYGSSRIDFFLERVQSEGNTEKILMEVKGCTLENDGIGYFPDAPTIRGIKHIHELIGAAREGYTAILAFVIQMDGIREVHPNIATHPEFGTAIDEARKSNVNIVFFTCHVAPDELLITGESEKGRFFEKKPGKKL